MSQRPLPRPHGSRRDRQRRRAQTAAAARPTFDLIGCRLDDRCVAGRGHEGDCVPRFTVWDGMPDPHRHNPYAVGLVLVLFAIVAYCAITFLVLGLIAGWRP